MISNSAGSEKKSVQEQLNYASAQKGLDISAWETIEQGSLKDFRVRHGFGLGQKKFPSQASVSTHTYIYTHIMWNVAPIS